MEEIEKLKSEITDYESQIAMMRRHNDELDTQLKSSQAKITSLENEIAANKREIEKLMELNQKLQREKQDIFKSVSAYCSSKRYRKNTAHHSKTLPYFILSAKNIKLKQKFQHLKTVCVVLNKKSRS